MWVHCFAWVLSSYGKSPVEALSMAQCLGHLVEVAPCKRRSRTCREQGWAQTCAGSSVAQLVLPLGRKPWAGREPCCDFGFILLFYYSKGMKCWFRDARAQQHKAHKQPWFPQRRLQPLAQPGKHQLQSGSPSREKPKEFTEMIVKDPIILQLG